SDSERIRMLQQQNEDLQRRLALSTHKMEAAEAEFDGGRRYMEAELSRTRDDLDKMRDKLQNSYTASQRANQDLEEKLHALAAVSQTWVHALRKVERDKKTMDQEIVELTNKLLDAKNTVDRLEELNERYRQDCNLAVQLLKCNKSHFRNHKFADLPYELQDMLRPGGQDPDTLSLTPADVVPTSVIARVLEKPEPLLLNSAQSSSCSRPVAEDVFVHVDMTGAELPSGRTNVSCSVLDGQSGGEESAAAPSFEKLNPYPAPPPPHPLYPGRKVIEFSSDDKVKIPKNSPLPNCTYATRQAISLSLVQSEDPAPASPAPSSSSGGGAPAHAASSEEDLLANWQRMFVEKMAPACDGSALHRTAFGSQTAAELQRRRAAPGEPRGPPQHHREAADEPGGQEEEESSAEERDVLPHELPVISPRLLDLDPALGTVAPPLRPQKSPKRMGVHHLLRKDSLTRAQEQGTLLD
uniref:Tight junction associated protein 1 (peripheral) n=1 Tax=Sander lucioperca TaxID=283035 RepID=A0A8C9ZU38_SANLU